MPRKQHTVHQRNHAFECERSSSIHNHGYGFTCFGQFSHQVFLHTRQIEVGSAVWLSTQTIIFTHKQKDFLWSIRSSYSSSKQWFVSASRIEIAGSVVDFGFCESCLQTGKRCDWVLGISIGSPATYLVLLVVSKSTNHCQTTDTLWDGESVVFVL